MSAKIIEQRFRQCCQNAVDIREHLPVLKNMAMDCKSVVELGVRGVVSTWAFLSAFPDKIISVDINPCPVEEAAACAKAMGIDFQFIHADDLTIDLPEHDLLFIDTWHRYEQLKAELQRHGNKARKYIVMHDTNIFGTYGQGTPTTMQDKNARGLNLAIDEFLADNRHWRVLWIKSNCNGLTALERVQ